MVVVTMWKRAAALASTSLALLALCGSQALAGVQVDSVKRTSSIPPPAVLDPSFGGDGLVTLPGETLGWTAYGAATLNGDLLVSGGPTLWLLTGSGDPVESFGGADALSPLPSAGVKFSLSDLTLDSEGRLLVVGTSHFGDEGDSVNGFPPPIEPSAVRILRFLPNGFPDPTFGQGGVIETDFGLPPPHGKQGRPLQPDASLEATGIAVDAQGHIVVTGRADIRLGESCARLFRPVAVSAAFLVRLTENGALDPGFGGDGIVGGRKLSETPLRAQSVGEPVIGPNGGITYRSTGVNPCGLGGRWGVAQLTPDGRTRKRLGRKAAVGGYFTALAGRPDGSVVALARMSWTEGEAFRARLIRIAPDGEVDRSFGHNGRTVVKLGSSWGNEPDSLAVDAQGRTLLSGTLVTRKRGRSILLARLSADGRQEMNFGPNGRVATSFPSLAPFGPSDLFFDPEGRVVTVHRYEHRDKTGEVSGLVLARYVLLN